MPSDPVAIQYSLEQWAHQEAPLKLLILFGSYTSGRSNQLKPLKQRK